MKSIDQLFGKDKRSKKEKDDPGWSSEEEIIENTAVSKQQPSKPGDLELKSLIAEWECFKPKMENYLNSKRK